jgi:hypothetical protein
MTVMTGIFYVVVNQRKVMDELDGCGGGYYL